MQKSDIERNLAEANAMMKKLVEGLPKDINITSLASLGVDAMADRFTDELIKEIPSLELEETKKAVHKIFGKMFAVNIIGK